MTRRSSMRIVGSNRSLSHETVTLQTAKQRFDGVEITHTEIYQIRLWLNKLYSQSEPPTEDEAAAIKYLTELINKGKAS